MERDADFATSRKHVDRSVVVVVEEGAIGRRRLTELLHFFPQRCDVVSRFTECVGQFLVLADGLRQLTLCLEKSLFKRANALGSILKSASQRRNFFFEDPELLPQFVVRGTAVDICILGAHFTDLLVWVLTLSAVVGL